MRNSSMSLLEKRYLHHSATRTCEPETNLPLSWRKFVANSVLFHTHKYWETRLRTKFRFVSKTEIKSRPGKQANQDSPWNTKKEQILAEIRSEIQKHEVQAESDEKVSRKKLELLPSQRMEIDHTITGCEQFRRDQLLLQEELSEQNRDLRETRIKSLHEMEELKRVQELRVDDFSRRRLIEIQDTINELTARIQELQNDVNCMNDSRDFKDAKSARNGPSHVPSQPALFPSYRDPGGLLRRNNQPPDIWNSQGKSGNVFANPRASSSSPYPGGFNPWISNVTEDSPVLTSTGRGEGGPLHVVNIKTQTQLWIWDASLDRQPEIHSTLRREDSQIIMKQTNNDYRFWIFTLTNSHTNNICLLEDKIKKLKYALVHNFLRKLCYGSKEWRWLNQWMIWNLRVL